MKKREEAEVKKKQEDEMNKVAQQSYWRLSDPLAGQKPKKYNIEYEGSVAALNAASTVGRQSFKAFNPEVEKMKEAELRSRGGKDNAGGGVNKQISDQEMAQTLNRPRLHDRMMQPEEEKQVKRLR